MSCSLKVETRISPAWRVSVSRSRHLASRPVKPVALNGSVFVGTSGFLQTHPEQTHLVGARILRQPKCQPPCVSHMLPQFVLPMFPQCLPVFLIRVGLGSETFLEPENEKRRGHVCFEGAPCAGDRFGVPHPETKTEPHVERRF